jgi:hypothetical protein
VRRNNTSNQTNVLNYVFSGFPNLFTSQERNVSNPDRRIYKQASTPINYYPPHTPITQTNLRNQSQNHNPCFHPESTLGWLFGGGNFVSLPTSNKLSYFDKDGKTLTPDEITKIHNETPSTIFYLNYVYDYARDFSDLGGVRRTIIHC